jgi:uncharacterized protein YneF (UPF0154 family)
MTAEEGPVKEIIVETLECLWSIFKKIAKILLKIFLILLILLIVVEIGIAIYEKYLSTTYILEPPIDYESIHEQMKHEPSDIEGMTLYDKYEMGLSTGDGSDSDGDGLTDKEEIEVYGSDPLAVSTSGDLYTDKYKVEHNMDLFSYYEYQNDLTFKSNRCDNVTLEMNEAFDVYAVVEDKTGTSKIDGYEIYAEYEVYYYSGRLTIDLTDILEENNLSMSDISVCASDGFRIRKLKFKADRNVITTKKKLDEYCTFRIFITNKSAKGYWNTFIHGDEAISPASGYPWEQKN